MTQDEKKKLYAALSAPLPEEAVERTDGRTTGRGYSTTGIKYQYIANRLNEVLGIGGFRAHRTVTVREITTQNGRKMSEAICDITLELGEWSSTGVFVAFAEALADGGHVAVLEADARKGSYTNAFKKAAAFLGVGKQAYEGSIDDDSLLGAPEPPPAARAQGPAASAPAAPTPAQPARGGGATSQTRLSPKQLGAIWAIARKQGFDQVSFRGQVKANYGGQVEVLTPARASELITALNSGAFKPNGHVAAASGG